MYEFNIELANIPIKVACKHNLLKEQSTEYLTTKAEVFSAFVTDRDIAFEAEQSLKYNGVVPDEAYLENTAIYRKICNRLIDFDAFLIHSAVIEIDGGAIAFLGKSGDGKTTQSRHWVNNMGARYINGDKPIIRRVNDKFFAFGTPWAGKENYNANISAPIKAFVQVHKAKENKIELVSPFDAVPLVLSRIHYDNGVTLSKTMDMLDSILNDVPFFNLYCNLDPNSALIAYDAIKKYYEDKL